jgi:putative ABC transport system permease protein
MEQRALASSLTAVSMALGVAVMIAVIVIYGVAVRQFDQNAQGYHLIVGGKGGRLQLVLNTVYHIGDAPFPIPYSYYQKFLPGGEFAEVTAAAIPQCLGDSYEAPNGTLFRVIGTTPDLFEKINYGTDRAGKPTSYQVEPGGRNLRDAGKLRGEAFHEAAFESVIGSVVAREAGLKLGDEIQPTHGIGSEGHKHEGFTVVGILKPTGTANDRAVFINIEGFYRLEGHALSEQEGEKVAGEASSDQAASGEHEHHAHADEPLPIEQREVTSILVLCSSPLGPEYLNFKINKGEDRIAQAVAPAREVELLKESFVRPIRTVLLVLTVLVVIVAGVGILVSIYNSMTERSHDIAVMRALGASRKAVMVIVLVESILLSLGGGLIGMLLGHGLVAAASPYVMERTGIALGLFEFDWQELLLIPGLLLLASLVGFLPAVAAYRTDVSKALSGSR